LPTQGEGGLEGGLAGRGRGGGLSGRAGQEGGPTEVKGWTGWCGEVARERRRPLVVEDGGGRVDEQAKKSSGSFDGNE
jgi:hypothetical protein